MQTSEVRSQLNEIAEGMISRYAPNLLSVEWLEKCLRLAWMQSDCVIQEEDQRMLEQIAQGLCSQALCEGCFSTEKDVRERAFADLEHYLGEVLARSASSLSSELRAEVLQQTLLEIWSGFQQRGSGPDKPRAFLKWVRVILLRQLSKHRDRAKRVLWLSLETQPEQVFEELVAEKDPDPLITLLQQELRGEILAAILDLKNPQYREVLLGYFFGGLEEYELAARLQVRMQDIYLWRCRALKALRNHKNLAKRAGY